MNPFSGSPSISLSTSSLILRRYSARFTAVATSLPVKAMGRPIWTVSSSASSPSCWARILRNFLTISCLSLRVVLRKLWKASVATLGMDSRSAGETPFLVRMPSLVEGEMVVRTSTDII